MGKQGLGQRMAVVDLHVVLKRVVDAQLDILSSGTHEDLAADMAEEATAQMRAKRGVDCLRFRPALFWPHMAAFEIERALLRARIRSQCLYGPDAGSRVGVRHIGQFLGEAPCWDQEFIHVDMADPVHAGAAAIGAGGVDASRAVCGARPNRRHRKG